MLDRSARLIFLISPRSIIGITYLWDLEMSDHVEWIESGGGPLLLLASAAAKSWMGDLSPQDGSSQSDYWRACAIEDEIGVISVGGMQAVVLGDSPDRTALLPKVSGFLVLRWRWADSEDALLAAVRLSVDQLPFVFSENFRGQSGEYALFDSAREGERMGAHLSVTLEQGVYAIETALFNPDKNTCALIHRIQLR